MHGQKEAISNSDFEMEPFASVKPNNLISATSDDIRDVIAICPNIMSTRPYQNLVGEAVCGPAITITHQRNQ